MIKQKKRWVLVADGARARIFLKTHKHLENAIGYDLVAKNLKDSEVGNAKPGRTFESSNPTRHAYSPRTDWHQHQKDLFAQELCDVLEKANLNKEIDELILVVPAKTLGGLRAHLSKPLTAKVSAEISKDVTKLTEPELLEFLEREI